MQPHSTPDQPASERGRLIPPSRFLLPSAFAQALPGAQVQLRHRDGQKVTVTRGGWRVREALSAEQRERRIKDGHTPARCWDGEPQWSRELGQHQPVPAGVMTRQRRRLDERKARPLA